MYFFQKAAGLYQAGDSAKAERCHNPQDFLRRQECRSINSLHTAHNFQKAGQDTLDIVRKPEKIKKNAESVCKGDVSAKHDKRLCIFRARLFEAACQREPFTCIICLRFIRQDFGGLFFGKTMT